jgi:hypothetical protein
MMGSNCRRRYAKMVKMTNNQLSMMAGINYQDCGNSYDCFGIAKTPALYGKPFNCINEGCGH